MPFRKQSRDRQGQPTAERALLDLRSHGGAFVEAIEATRMPMVVTDPRIDGNPIIYANGAFLGLCGYEREEVLGRNYLFLMGDDADTAVAGRVRDAMAARQDLVEDMRFRTRDGGEIWVAAYIAPMSTDGRVVRHVASFLDVSDRVAREAELREARASLERRVEERTASLREANALLQQEVERRRRTEAELRGALVERQEEVRFRDFLVQEVNHRTKNTLQLGIGLLGLQARRVEDPGARAALEAATGRLRRMGEVHAQLAYQPEPSGRVDFAAYLRRLCRDVAASLAPAPGHVVVQVECAEEAIWGPDVVVPLGLIVGEALTNALQHAFPEGRSGRVLVRLGTSEGAWLRLSIEDDGAGLPAKPRDGSLGLRLIETLARQIRGTARVEPRCGGGTVVAVTFPDPSGNPGG